MDIIAYIPDLIKFRAEATILAEQKIKGFSFDSNGNLNYGITKIPVIYKGLESVCLLRITDDEDLKIFNDMTSIENIGNYDGTKYVFKKGGKVKYENIYDITPQKITDIDGNITTYTPPYMIGVFA